MLETDSQAKLKEQISARVVEDRAVLDELRAEIRPLRTAVRRILPRTTTAISLVGTDGGDNAIPFDPFLIQLIRVVDSSNNEYCLEVISPSMSEIGSIQNAGTAAQGRRQALHFVGAATKALTEFDIWATLPTR